MSEPVTIQGRSINLLSGARVWGGVYNDSICWKFTSKDGADTRVTLSHEAVSAMVHIYQGLIGCDHGFALVDFGKSPVSEPAEPT